MGKFFRDVIIGNKVFKKTAAGPFVYKSDLPGGYTFDKRTVSIARLQHGRQQSRFGMNILLSAFTKGEHTIKDVTKRGLIVIPKSPESVLPFTQKTNYLTHELTHWLRSKKGKWSARKYALNPLATFVDELAAYKRGGENIGRSIQGAIWTVAAKSEKPWASLLAKVLTKR